MILWRSAADENSFSLPFEGAGNFTGFTGFYKIDRIGFWFLCSKTPLNNIKTNPVNPVKSRQSCEIPPFSEQSAKFIGDEPITFKNQALRSIQVLALIAAFTIH